MRFRQRSPATEPEPTTGRNMRTRWATGAREALTQYILSVQVSAVIIKTYSSLHRAVASDWQEEMITSSRGRPLRPQALRNPYHYQRTAASVSHCWLTIFRTMLS